MKFEAEWVSAVATLISSVSIVFLIVQTIVMRKQTKDDHERSRREKAVDIVMYWHEHLDQENSIARKFAETLSEENLRLLLNNSEFCLDSNDSNKEYIKGVFNLNEEQMKEIEKEGHLRIDGAKASKLRWQLVKYLNLLEGVVSAWVCKVADQELIETEFKYMFENSNTALKKVRIIYKDSFPCIDIFEQKMIEKNRMNMNKRFKLG